MLVGSLTPLGLSIDRCINILYCSKFKALYMMGVDIFLYVEEGIKQLCKNFFFNLFSIYFLTSFHLVGSKSWDSFILLNESANTDFSFFWGWGAGLHRNRSHHGLLTVRSQTTGTLWYLYTQHFWQKSGQRISCTLIWLFGGVVWHFLILQLSKSLPGTHQMMGSCPYPYIYIQPEKVGKRGSLE